jgi:hypothetical protein
VVSDSGNDIEHCRFVGDKIRGLDAIDCLQIGIQMLI